MSNINRISDISYFKFCYIILFILILLIPIIFWDIKPNQQLNNYNPKLKVSKFSKEDYSAILDEEEQSLGNVTVNDINLEKLEPGFLMYNNTYPLIGEDYASDALNMTRIKVKFIETIEPAIQDNINQEIIDTNKIQVKVNESYEVEYNNPQSGYLIYLPRLFPNKILEVYVDDGGNLIDLINETDFQIDKDNFLLFNYKEFFLERSSYNFKIYIIWRYQLSVQNWRIIQHTDQNLLVNDIIQNFDINYNYYFRLYGGKFGNTIKDNIESADNINVALTINLPDKSLLDYQSFLINNISVIVNDHLNLDKSIEIYLSDYFILNQSWVSLNFTTQFTFKFENPVEKDWAIDRLIYDGNSRERIYLASIIDGPNRIYVQDLFFYDYNIRIEQIFSTSSLFKRDVEFFYLNSSIIGREGVEIRIPFLILGETCPCIVKYRPTQNLRIVITDNIKMPLVGANIDVFYYGKEYGTYISNEKTQPMALTSSNEHGEIIIKNVPHGNYTTRVYYNGIFLKEAEVSIKNDINYIYTDYPHFPFWLILFGGINGIILIIGAIFYLINKKKR